MNRQTLKHLVTDYGDKILLGAAAAWLLSYLTLSILFADANPNARSITQLKNDLEDILQKKNVDPPPFVSPDVILVEYNVPPPTLNMVTWGFQIQPVVNVVAKVNSVGSGTVKPPVLTVLPPPLVESLQAGIDGVKLAWKPGAVPTEKQGSPIRGYYVERKGPKEDKFVRLNKDPLPPDQVQFHDPWLGQALPMTEYQYRVVAYTDDKLSEAAARGGHVSSEAKEVTTRRAFDVKLLGGVNDNVKIRIERYSPQLNNFIYADFDVRKGSFLGHPEGKNEHKAVVGYLKDSTTPAMNPETNKPEWDFHTGYQVKDIKLGATFKPSYRSCDRSWDNTLQEWHCNGMQTKNDRIVSANVITVAYTLNGKEVSETFSDKKIEIDDRALRCEEHGGTLLKKPKPPKKEEPKQEPPKEKDKPKDDKKPQ